MFKSKAQFLLKRSAVSARRSKFGAKKVGGYASKKEYRRSWELKMLARAGEISDLREQVKYELIPAQYDETGRCIERAMSYIADFVYRNKAGDTVVEDVKGYRTKEYRIKRKLMLSVHNIKITEI
jgi:hypothetical protein